MTAPIHTPKAAAQILRSLADNFEKYDALAECGTLDPQARLVAVVEALQNGAEAELDAKDVAFLVALGVPAAAIAPALSNANA